MTTATTAVPRRVDWRRYSGRRLETRAAIVAAEHEDGTLSLLVEGSEAHRVPRGQVFDVTAATAGDWVARYGREHLRGR